ncbi:BnaC02g46560D [Brassica napus]|uniref:BnaC02g46560D protein n=1 Tax=Brassica napus TaxID=3708 RepID=A0A078JK45_BRANA|nr:BnaC02g46560D [Brassica napus]
MSVSGAPFSQAAVPHSTLTLSASLGRTIQFVDSVIYRFIPAGLANHYRPSLLAGSIAKVDRFEDLSNHRIGQVDEFKKMLKHAKEANDMHAGEVYGDKSILATEAKELENRLLNLSEEQNKSLHVLDEAC